MLPNKLKRLVNIISYMPWIGERSATRLAFFLLKSNEAYISQFEKLLSEIQTDIQDCKICYSLTDNESKICNICNNESRDNTKICIIEDYLDLISLEQTWVFKWVYHVLGWSISPINWVLASSLNFKGLFDRVKDIYKDSEISDKSKVLENNDIHENKIIEIIIATNPNIEWEATALYIKEHIPHRDKLKISRLSRWLPNSWYIEYADEATLINAFEWRSIS